MKWFSAIKGFGFLRPDGAGASDPDIFLHFSELPGDGYRTTEEGARFSFTVEETPKGLTARNLEAIGND